MSFNISGVSSINTQINQIQTQAQMEIQASNQQQSVSYQEDQVDLGTSEQSSGLYNSNGTTDQAQYDARLISNTFDRLNANPFGSSADRDSYQFSQDVLSAYSKF